MSNSHDEGNSTTSIVEQVLKQGDTKESDSEIPNVTGIPKIRGNCGSEQRMPIPQMMFDLLQDIGLIITGMYIATMEEYDKFIRRNKQDPTLPECLSSGNHTLSEQGSST
jgi:hypothetical protein